MQAAEHDNLDGSPAASRLPPEALATSVTRVTAGALLLVALTLAALFYYKWGGSLRTLGIVRSSGKLPIAPSLILDARRQQCGGDGEDTLGSHLRSWGSPFLSSWLALRGSTDGASEPPGPHSPTPRKRYQGSRSKALPRLPGVQAPRADPWSPLDGARATRADAWSRRGDAWATQADAWSPLDGARATRADAWSSPDGAWGTRADAWSPLDGAWARRADAWSPLDGAWATLDDACSPPAES
jgi:hypothetical protein